MRLDLRDYIQLRIFYESHEPQQLAFFERFLRQGRRRAGRRRACRDLHARRCSRVGPAGARARVRARARQLCRAGGERGLNGFDNVVLNRAAVGAEDGEVAMGVPDVVPDRGRRRARCTRSAAAAVRSRRRLWPSTPMFPSRLAGRPIRILKMDVEGLEPSVPRRIRGHAERDAAGRDRAGGQPRAPPPTWVYRRRAPGCSPRIRVLVLPRDARGTAEDVRARIAGSVRPGSRRARTGRA